MSEISSGLVAVCNIEVESGYTFISPYGFPVIRLSDAEAIISKLSSKERYGVCDECGTPYSFDPTDGGTICVKCQKDKITKQAERIKELEEQCRTNHSMEIDSLSRKCDEQSAALKLARQALVNVRETSSSTRLRRIVNDPLAAIDEVLEGE